MCVCVCLHCEHPGCEFMALNKAGLVNHTRQKHQEPQLVNVHTAKGLSTARVWLTTGVSVVQDPPTIECSLHLSFFLGLYHSASHEVLGSAKRMERRKVCVCM